MAFARLALLGMSHSEFTHLLFLQTKILVKEVQKALSLLILLLQECLESYRF